VGAGSTRADTLSLTSRVNCGRRRCRADRQMLGIELRPPEGSRKSRTCAERSCFQLDRNTEFQSSNHACRRG